MKNKSSKVIAFLLAAVFTLSSLSLNLCISPFAAQSDNSFEYSGSFGDIDVTTLDSDFTTTVITKDGTVTEDLPSKEWSTAAQPDGAVEYRYHNNLLKPKDSKNLRLLTLKDVKLTDFTASIEFLNTYTWYGLMFGMASPTDMGVYSNSTEPKINSGTVHIRMHENAGKLYVQGVDVNSAKWVSSSRNESFYSKAAYSSVYDTVARPNFSTAVNGTNLHTLKIEVKNGVLKIWWEGYEDYAWTADISDDYDGGYIALYSRGCAQGGIKSFSVKGERTQIQYVDGSNCNFDSIDSVELLDRDFDAFVVEKDATEGVKGKPSEYWTKSSKLPSYEGTYKNTWLKPLHLNGSGKNTLLTYNKSEYTNVDIIAEYVTNYIRYGVMVAPLGKISTVQNGVRVFVESNGVINIQGAVDAGDAWATGGQVKITGKNSLSGYPISSHKEPSKENMSYHLRVKILDKVMTVWIDEFSDYVLSVPLTDDFNGGYVSLYSSGYNQGAFKSFKIEQLQSGGDVATDKTFSQSFNTIDSLDALTQNFAAYKLETKEGNVSRAEIDELFVLNGGKLKSGLKERGNDNSGFAILTLKNKRYENFELTLKYEQDWLRYGVMFGTELGEFAFFDDGTRTRSNAGAVCFTEAEGYRNVKGALYSSLYTNAAQCLHRVTDTSILDSFDSFSNNVETTLNKRPIHTLKIRVVNGYMTFVVDGDETSRTTVRLADYNGGYISLITNAEIGRNNGAFCSISVTELNAEDELNAELPNISNSIETLTQVDKLFDAYYLKDAAESTALQKVDVKKHWWINNEGYIARSKAASGIKETNDVEMLTYTERTFTDFELTYTYQQTYQRTGIVIGGDLKNYPIKVTNGTLSADKGALFYIEAEGYPNVKGHLHNVSSKDYLIYKTTKNSTEGFVDTNNNPSYNVNAKKAHTVKIIVKNKQLYAFLDGNTEPCLYVKLGDNYNGGYVSIFSSASDLYGIKNFSISESITTQIPQEAKVITSGNNIVADFNSFKFDASEFKTYYLDTLQNNADGSLQECDFDDQWTVCDGVLKKTQYIDEGSDSSRVSVLTYDKKLTDFVITYSYQKYDKRLMLMFGAEKGKYPLCNKGEADLINGGVLLYPENDLGTGGGILALGSVTPLTAAYRPVNKTEVKLAGYHDTDDWTSNFGVWHTLTVVVVNSHCYIYLDDYGMIADYQLHNYNGGYVSLAAAGNKYGFDNVSITDLSSISSNSIVSVENPRDVTVKVGTNVSDISLPTTVNAKLKNGQTVKVNVNWKAVGYDSSVEGNNRFTAVLPEGGAFENPAGVGAVLNVRIKNTVSATSEDVKQWSFDTPDDLLDFKAYYLKDKDTGYIKDIASWYANGKLGRDEQRAVNGSDQRDLAILTYYGATYKNFELEVEYSHAWTRMMVMFGSKQPGQYIDLNNVHSAENPVSAYVEYEGIRNFIGNVKNANYYTRIEETIYSARESGGIVDYYDPQNLNSSIGKMHKMKLRVVGDKAYMWIDDNKTPFIATLTDYSGGYISLISTTKGGKFDNLKITRLDEQGDVVYEDPKALANGNMNLQIDKNASDEFKAPKAEKAEKLPKATVRVGTEKTETVSKLHYVIGSAVLILFIMTGALLVLLVIIKKSKIRSKTL